MPPVIVVLWYNDSAIISILWRHQNLCHWGRKNTPKKAEIQWLFHYWQKGSIYTPLWIDEYKNINFTIKQYLSEGWQPCLYCMFWHLHTAPILDFPGGKVFHVNGMKIDTLSELFWPFWPFSAEVKRFVTNECTLCAWSGKENKSRCLQLVPINQKCI